LGEEFIDFCSGVAAGGETSVGAPEGVEEHGFKVFCIIFFCCFCIAGCRCLGKGREGRRMGEEV
jgi:hypothetical protein